jgi:transposase
MQCLRKFPPEFRRGVVTVARRGDLTLTEVAVGRPKRQAGVDDGIVDGLTTAEQEELARLPRDKRMGCQSEGVATVSIMARGGRPHPETLFDPSDYLLEGRPTTPAQLRRVLELVLEDLGADEVVLVTISGRKILRSVSFSTTNTARGRGLATTLRHGATLGDPQHQLVLAELSPEAFIDVLRDQPPLAAFIPSMDQITVLAPPRQRSRHSTTVRVVAFNMRSSPSEVGSSLVALLEVMVNTSANVDVAKDIALTTAVTHLGSRLPAMDEDLVRPSEIDQLLTLVLHAIDADSVALYERTPDGASLRLVRATPSDIVIPHEGMLLTDDTNVNSVAVTRRRPVFLTPDQVGLSAPAQGPKDLTSAWSLSEDVRDTNELAMPVPSAPLGRLGPTYGVLNVCRAAVNADRAHFNRYDLAVMRNLALRVGFAIHTNRLVNAQRALAKLVSRGHSTSPGRTSTAGMFRALAGPTDGVPSDFHAARPLLNDLVHDLADATSAATCTLRLLLPGDGRHRKKRQWSLVRFAASPEERLHDDAAVLPMGVNSVHGWVARTGTSCYIPDLGDSKFFKRYPGLGGPQNIRNSKSEMCFPVMIDQRLVGTLNLESRVIDAFAIHLGTAESFAAAAGQLLASALSDIAETTLSFTSAVHNSAHAILQSLDGISRSVNARPPDEFTSDMTHRIQSIEDLLSETSDPMDQFRADPQWPGADLMELIELVRRAVKLEHLTVVAPTDSSPLVDAHLAPAIKFAFADVLAGVQRYMSRAPGDRAFLEVHRRTIGGRPYVDVVIVYPSSTPLPSSLTEQLYRVPLAAERPGEDRPHLGSYSAGAVVRNLGGDLFFRVTGTKRAEVLISLPVLHLSVS